MHDTARFHVATLLLVALILAGCGDPLVDVPGNPGIPGAPGGPGVGSLSINFQLANLDDASVISVDMVFHVEGPITTAPVADTDLMIDHVLGTAVGQISNLIEGLWDVKITAEMATGPNRVVETQVVITAGQKYVWNGQLSPDPGNATGLLITP